MRPALALLLLLTAVGCGREDAEGERDKAAATTPSMPANIGYVASVPAPGSAPAPAAMGSERAMLTAWLSAWNDHDAQRAGELLADDVEFFDSGFAGLQHGREAAVERGVSVFLRGVPNLRWELRGEPIIGKDAVAWEWTFTGTHTGTWGGVPATRQQINLKGVSLMKLRNGRIASVASYYDSNTLNRQLGL